MFGNTEMKDEKYGTDTINSLIVTNQDTIIVTVNVGGKRTKIALPTHLSQVSISQYACFVVNSRMANAFLMLYDINTRLAQPNDVSITDAAHGYMSYMLKAVSQFLDVPVEKFMCAQEGQYFATFTDFFARLKGGEYKDLEIGINELYAAIESVIVSYRPIVVEDQRGRFFELNGQLFCLGSQFSDFGLNTKTFTVAQRNEAEILQKFILPFEKSYNDFLAKIKLLNEYAVAVANYETIPETMQVEVNAILKKGLELPTHQDANVLYTYTVAMLAAFARAETLDANNESTLETFPVAITAIAQHMELRKKLFAQMDAATALDAVFFLARW